MLNVIKNLTAVGVTIVLGVTLAQGGEPLVKAELDGMPLTIEVWGADDCRTAESYAKQALADPTKSATGQSFDTVEIIGCSTRRGNRNANIEMTHLDGWAWK